MGVKNLLNWTPAKNNPFLIARSEDPFDRGVEITNATNINSALPGTSPEIGEILPTQSNPFGLSFDPTYIYAPNQGRRFFIGLNYSLSK